MTKLSTAVDNFVMHLRMEGKARATITAYESDCNLLVALATVHGGDSVLSFTPSLVTEYFMMLSRRDLKMATLHRRRASIAEFARWGLRRRLWALDPMADAPRIRRPRYLPRPYTHAEIDRLLGLTLGRREHVLRALLYYAGLRISEALGLQLKNVVLGDDDHPAYLRIRGKGDKERVVPMFPELRAVLVEECRDRLAESLNAFLIRQANERPWRRQMAERRVREWGRALSVPDCTCHRFRHGCATRLHELGWDIRDIQAFLGHADLKTTALYADVSPRHLMETARRMPLSVKTDVRL